MRNSPKPNALPEKPAAAKSTSPKATAEKVPSPKSVPAKPVTARSTTSKRKTVRASTSTPAPTLSKAERELADLEMVFAALAHASRRHILLVLHFRGGEMSAGEIAGRFGCSWPTTTRHLAILVDAGLIGVEKRGRERIYRIDATRLRDVAGGWLATFDKPDA